VIVWRTVEVKKVGWVSPDPNPRVFFKVS